MTSKAKDHSQDAIPGKAVPDAIGSRGHEDKRDSEAASHDTVPSEAFEKAQHGKSAKNITDKARNLPGKVVPVANSKGKH